MMALCMSFITLHMCETSSRTFSMADLGKPAGVIGMSYGRSLGLLHWEYKKTLGLGNGISGKPL